MKTSFYFFLWFIIYWLIGLTGSPLLIQNGFIVALVVVYIISWLDRKWFAAEKVYENQLNLVYIFEIFYRGEVKKMIAIYRNKLIWEVVWTVYCFLTVVSLFIFSHNSFVAIIIFAIFGAITMVSSFKTFNMYSDLRQHGLPSFEDSPYGLLSDQYRNYCSLRSEYTPEQLLPEIPSISKWVNIASIIFAILCILGGIAYMMIIFITGQSLNLAFSPMLIWSVLAIYFGVKDLIESIRLLKGRPVPNIKPF